MKNSVLKKIVTAITNNFGLKVLAVITSCVLWFVVNSITDPLQKQPFYNIPVEIINADMVTNEGKVYEVLDGTNLVNVTVIGKSKALSDLSRDDIKAVADMSELTIMNTIAIKVSSTRNNSDLDFKTNIDAVKLSIEQRVSDQKPINAYTSGDPAADYVVGGIKPSQNVVRFSGPESLIEQIDHVDAVVSVDGASSDIDTSVDLKLYDAENNEIRNSSIKMNISTINVNVTIYATKAVPLSFVIPDKPANGYVVSSDIFSMPETVTIAGRSSVLDDISKIVVTDSALSVEGMTENVTKIINIGKYLPPNVQFADSSFGGNVSVTIGIEQLVTRELQIPARNLAAENKSERLKLTLAEVADQEYYTIRISGTRAAVENVNAEDVVGVVDMDSLFDGLEASEWTAGIYQGELIFNIPDNVALERTYYMTILLEEIPEENDVADDGDNE